MNDKTRELVKKLMVKAITDDEFIDKFNIKMKLLPEYIEKLLRISFNEKNAKDIDYLLFIGFRFNLFSEKYIEILCKLIEVDWHYQHENIAMIFDKLKSPKTIDYLYKTAITKFKYLDYDESYALAVKCVWALKKINNFEAYKKLQLLSNLDNEIIKTCAIERLNEIEGI